VYPRRHLLRPTAVEIFLTTRQALMFNFESAAVVTKVDAGRQLARQPLY
jgi:hypothetical protein